MMSYPWMHHVLLLGQNSKGKWVKCPEGRNSSHAEKISRIDQSSKDGKWPENTRMWRTQNAGKIYVNADVGRNWTVWDDEKI